MNLNVSCFSGPSKTSKTKGATICPHKKTEKNRLQTVMCLKRLPDDGDMTRTVSSNEGRWFERVVKEAIHLKLKKPYSNRGGGLRHFRHPHNIRSSTLWGNIPNIHTVWRDLMTHHLVTQQTKGEGSQQKLEKWPCQRLSGDHPGH